MRFYLVKEKHVVFQYIPAKTKTSPVYYAEQEVSVPADLDLDEMNSDEDGQSFLRQFKSIIIKCPPEDLARKCLPSGQEQNPTVTMEPENQSNNLLVQIGMNGGQTSRSFVRVTDEAEGNILEKIRAAMETYKLEWKIGFQMENYKCNSVTNGTECICEGFASGLADLAQISSNKIGSEGTDLFVSKEQISIYWSQPNYLNNHNAVISIFWEIYHTPPLPILASKNSTQIGEINQRILTEEIMTDAIIRTKDNAEIKCHASFLAVQSDVLEKAFGGSFEESKTKVIEMPDMSSTGVKAFLAFLYYADLEKATENSATAVEVLQASHKYNVGNLEEQMKTLLLAQPDEWFDVEAALKLFLFTRLLEPEEKLKFRAVQLIKANYSSFESSPMYKELFEENLEAAKELFKNICML